MSPESGSRFRDKDMRKNREPKRRERIWKIATRSKKPAPEVFIAFAARAALQCQPAMPPRAGVAAISALTIKMVPPMGPINLTFANEQGQLYPLRWFLAAHPTKT